LRSPNSRRGTFGLSARDRATLFAVHALQQADKIVSMRRELQKFLAPWHL